ncbi:MAG: HAMP domain-containing histidine kinase [Chloroflexi bacterium]|nr:HAMP domain-containing histidine kinase [Chloroflexota bacterium]
MTARALVLASGLAVAAVAAAVAGMPAGDTVQLVALSFGVALAVYVAGRAALHRRQHPAVVAIIPVASLALGALAAARTMFVSSHDLSALAVVLAGAGTAGLLGALALGAELRVAHERLEAGAARERALERNRRELVAWVSHDLRTPLAGIQAMVEALDDEVVSARDDVRDYHRRLVVESARLSRLIDDLFELSCIDADAVHLSLERVPLGELVSDAVAAAAVLADVKGVEVAGDGRRNDELPSVTASARELGRVVRNLLDNAIRQTPPGGRITVEVAADDGHAVLSVVDGCGGIPDDDLDRVFDVAYRGDPARTPSRDGSGAGLGLAIARGLVHAHDGEIAVRNEGDGCCFTVRLPLA